MHRRPVVVVLLLQIHFLLDEEFDEVDASEVGCVMKTRSMIAVRVFGVEDGFDPEFVDHPLDGVDVAVNAFVTQ